MNRKQCEESILKVLEIMEETYYELQDKIVPDALLDSLECAVNDILTWRSMGDDIAENTKQDLEYSEEYVKGLEIVLRAWTVRGSEEEEKIEELLSCLKNTN